MRRVGVEVCAAAMLLAGVAAVAQDSAATVWQKGVPPNPGIRAEFGDHSMQVVHREASGRVEVHKTKSDVIVIQTGSGTLLTGKVVVDPVTTAPNELQGASIRGGVSRALNVGDVVEIPAGLPHQFLVAPGTQITYLVVKVDRR
jgi:mannose-6-phosphate isomerase-like protein (cupin superfamily)